MPQGTMKHLWAGRFALLEEHCSLWIAALHTYRGKTKRTSPATELSQLQAAPCFRQPLLFAPPLILIYLLKSIWQQIWLEKLLRFEGFTMPNFPPLQSWKYIEDSGFKT